MRMVMALLLGLWLAIPVQAARQGPVLLLPGLSVPDTEDSAAGRRCEDFLEAAGLRPEGLEYLFCRPGTDMRTGRPRLMARYRVPGARAAAVETALRERTGMAALERQMGIWQLPEGGEGRFFLPGADDGPACTVSMGEVPQQGTFTATREGWGTLTWFSVTVCLPLQ